VGAARATAVGAVHAAGAGSLLARAAGEGALELEHGAGDLVTHRGLALLGAGSGAAREEAAALVVGGCCCGGGGVARQAVRPLVSGGLRTTQAVGAVGSGDRLAAAGEEATTGAAGSGGGVGLAGAEERHVDGCLGGLFEGGGCGLVVWKGS
jgi:hypothetical protein